MLGNGDFQWFWGAGEEPTRWHGGYPTADRAAELAAGHSPNGNYTIVFADRVAIDPAIFSAPNVLAQLAEHEANVLCWPEVVPIAAPQELADLQAKLGDCLDRWLRKHGYDNTTALCEIRARDFFPARAVAK